MSFSSDVKKELLYVVPSSRHCRLAELAALVTMSGQLMDDLWQANDENKRAVNKAEKLMSLLDIDVNSEDGHQALKLSKQNESFVADRILIERACCKQAYLRGAFLASGSITDPEKSYHFEIVSGGSEHADLVFYILSELGLEPKMIARKKQYVVYLKDGSMIVDALNIMGAHISLMDMENVRIVKDMRNSINRRVNCETANINKTVNAAVKQMDDIRYIEETKGLKFLPDSLRTLAELRMEEPELPLKELGEMLTPPLGKSGVNHRLRKISEIANKLRRIN